MNTYEKLIYLASNPADKDILLKDSCGKAIDSMEKVIDFLKIDASNEDIKFDYRRACETAVHDH